MHLDSIQNNVQSTAKRSEQQKSVKTTTDPANYATFMVISIENEIYQLDDGSKWQIHSPEKIGLGDQIELIDSDKMKKMETGKIIKTTLIDLPYLERNVIKTVEWIYWAGERQPLVTLKDGSQWFFDEFATDVNFWSPGDRILVTHPDTHYYLINIDNIDGNRNQARLAHYHLEHSTDSYTIQDF